MFYAIVTFKYNCYMDFAPPTERYNYHKGDYESMKEELMDYNWESMPGFGADESGPEQVERMWESIVKVLITLVEKYVPKIKVGGKPKKGSFPIAFDLRDLIRFKKIAHRKWIRYMGLPEEEEHRKEFVKLRNKVKIELRKARRQHEASVAADAKTTPNRFWSHARKMLKTRCGISPLLKDPDDKSSLKYDDTEKAEILQRQFLSVFTHEPDGDLPRFPSRTDKVIDHIVFDVESVLRQLESLNPHKACGPDNIPPRLLKELAKYIASPITQLFNASMTHSILPKVWKTATVSPIYKKNSKHIASNYRPVSLTCILCKLFETLTRKSLMDHIMTNQLLSDSQFGFISGRSTTLNLLHFLDRCSEIVAEGDVADCIFFDFAKAFDTVAHKRLLLKLHAYGIRGKLLAWLEAFLVGRTQEVYVNGKKSTIGNVLSGVPQGSVLGPVLFLLMINDLPNTVNSHSQLFADDTKILHKVSNDIHSLTLQHDIDSLIDWASTWLLNFHPDKCKVITFGPMENIWKAYSYNMRSTEGNVVLEHIEEEKDLGIIFQENLSFDSHIHQRIKKANSMMGLIRRVFSFLDAKCFCYLYTAFVRSLLESSQAVWFPSRPTLVKHIEEVQIRATKLVDGFKDIDYEERLRKLKLPSLHYRRIKGDMVEVWKHFNVYDPNVFPKTFQLRTRASRAHEYQLQQHLPTSRYSYSKPQSVSFYYRVPRLWNKLPRDVVSASNIDTFKNRLDRHWENADFRFNWWSPPPELPEGYVVSSDRVPNP